MKLEDLTPEAQEGLRLWAKTMHDDDEGLSYAMPEEWAWVWFLLRATEDRPEFFPHGKWATIQFIGSTLDADADEHIKQKARERREESLRLSGIWPKEKA